MSMATLYVPELDARAASVELEGEAAHQLNNVLRAREDEKVRLLDGMGCEATASVRELSKSYALLKVDWLERDLAPPSPEIVLIQAWPKGDKAKTIVHQATELGAARIVFVTTERTIARPDPDKIENKLNKLRAHAVDALRLSRRRWLPEIDALASLEETPGEFGDVPKLALCLSEAESSRQLLAHLDESTHVLAPLNRITLLIGPEGGWSESELQTIEQLGYTSVQCGDAILATETAATVATGILSLWRESLA